MWFAIGTLIIFSLLSIGYLIAWLEREKLFLSNSNSKLVIFLLAIKKILHSNVICIFGAILGFAGIMITGALGGALAHGRDIDPVVNFIYGALIGK
jgi:hypothetical protein